MRGSTASVGVISDTHGLVRPEALSALRGVELILHAGDIGSAEVLADLARVAPVLAVRGNNDRGAWASAVPATRAVDVGGRRLYLLHDVHELDVDPVASGCSAVISGHSHRPLAERREGVLFLNPGSAGPRRFSLPVTLVRLTISAAGIRSRFVELVPSAKTARRAS